MTTRTGSAEEVDLTDMRPFVEGRQHELFRELREHDPLHWNDESDGGRGFWSLTRWRDVKDGANDHVRLSSAEGTQLAERRVEGKLHSLHNMDEPEHGKLRKIAVPYLRAVKIKRWQQSIAESVAGLLDEAEEKGEIDLVHAISANLPIRVLARVLGVPAQDCATLAELSNVAHIQDPEYVTSDDERESAREELFAYFKDLTDKRRRNPEDDLVSVLVQGTIDDRPLSWDQLAAYYIVLMAAGNETTRHLISGAVDAFHRFPREWQRLSDDRRLLAPAVEEMFRWVTPVAFMRRTALAPIDWHGRTIQPGQKVVLWFGSANRDERVFDDPDRFVVDRAPNDHLTFGWGVHFCMGAHLARAEVVSLFGQMLDRRLDVRLTAPPERLEASMFAGIKRMPAAVVRTTG